MNKILYKNFFQWYKDEHAKWEKEHPHNMYDTGIDKDTFKYFILQYLYNGPITVSDYEKMKRMFLKHSSRYRKELFYLKFFGKVYKPKAKDSYDEYLNRKPTFTEFITDKYINVPDDIFVDYCQLYLDGKYLSMDSIGESQYDLNSLIDILRIHSKRFRMEEYLYKLFK